MVGVASDENSLDPMGLIRWLAFGFLHVKAEDGVDLFESVEARLCSGWGFDGSRIIYVVDDGDARDCSRNGRKHVSEAVIGPDACS